MNATTAFHAHVQAHQELLPPISAWESRKPALALILAVLVVSHAFSESTNPFNRRIVDDRAGVMHECKPDIRKRNLVFDRKISCNMIVTHGSLLSEGIRICKQHNVAVLGRIWDQLVGFGLISNVTSPPGVHQSKKTS